MRSPPTVNRTRVTSLSSSGPASTIKSASAPRCRRSAGPSPLPVSTSIEQDPTRKIASRGLGEGDCTSIPSAIAQRLRQISKDFFQVHQGSLYPALHRLEDRGWLQAEWKESETGREAKFYSLTKKGRKQMDAEVADWERLCDAVGFFLRPPEKES